MWLREKQEPLRGRRRSLLLLSLNKVTNPFFFFFFFLLFFTLDFTSLLAHDDSLLLMLSLNSALPPPFLWTWTLFFFIIFRLPFSHQSINLVNSTCLRTKTCISFRCMWWCIETSFYAYQIILINKFEYIVSYNYFAVTKNRPRSFYLKLAFQKHM